MPETETEAQESSRAEGAALKYCENCGRPFQPIPLEAPHKRFCSAKCRDRFHYLKRKAETAKLKGDPIHADS